MTSTHAPTDSANRFKTLVERWKDLNEWTGCRTMAERNEMAEIADAVMPELIRFWELHSGRGHAV